MKDRTSLWIAIALAVAPFVLFAPEVLGLRAFYFNDVQNYFVPYRTAAWDIVRAGHLPLWNPYVSGGMPLLGDGQNAMLFPINWLALLLRPVVAVMIAIVANYSIAGVGMFALGRAMRFDRWPSAIGALGFMFCGHLTVHVVHLSIMATIAMVPWVFWAFERLLERRTIDHVAAAALVVALQLCAGHPQVPIYTAVALGLYALTIAITNLRRDRREAIAPIVSLAAMYVGGTLLAAIQLLPLFELARLSPRGANTSFEIFLANSVTGIDWWLLLFPFGYGGQQASWMQSVTDINFKLTLIAWERTAYVGIAPLVLAIAGLCDIRRTRSTRIVAIGVSLLAMLMIAAVGGLPIARAIHAIPVLGQLRANGRALGVVAFALNVLAMFGVQRSLALARERRVDWVAVVASTLVLGATTIALTIARSHHTDLTDPRAQQLWRVALRVPNRNATVPLALAIATLASVAIFRHQSRAKFIALALLIAIDLVCLARVYNLTCPARDFDTAASAATFLRADTEPFRVAVFTATDLPGPARAIPSLSMSWTMAFGIEDLNAYNSLQPRRCVDYLVSTRHPDVLYGMLSRQRLQPPYDRALIPLDVKYAILQRGMAWNPPAEWTKVYADEFVEICRNPYPIARATFAEFVKPVSDTREVLREMRSSEFNPQKVALVEGNLSADDVRPLWNGPISGATLTRLSNSPNAQVWRTTTSSPRLMILSEMFFPGWKAMVRKAGSSDAWQSVPIYRTNYLFRGIPVPAGDNEVRLVYRPMSVIIGAIVSSSTAVAMIVAIVMARRRRVA
jgi:hypothetical protein